MAGTTPTKHAASSRGVRWRRMATIATDALLATVASMAVFASLARVLPVELGSDDPAHENDAMAVFFVPVLAAAFAAIFALASWDGRTPGARLSGHRLALRRWTPRFDQFAPWFPQLFAYWAPLAGVPAAVFGVRWLGGSLRTFEPASVVLVALIVAGCTVIYTWPLRADKPALIERIITGLRLGS